MPNYYDEHDRPDELSKSVTPRPTFGLYLLQI